MPVKMLAANPRAWPRIPGLLSCSLYAWLVLACAISLGQFATLPQDTTYRASPRLASQHAGQIHSTPSDPFMDEHQEQLLLTALQAYDTTDFKGWTLMDLRSYLSTRFAVLLDKTELELVGVDAGTKLAADELPAGPLGLRLQTVLSPLELSYTLQGNWLKITSRDAIDACPPIRVYDVTPLVLRNQRGIRIYKYDELIELLQNTVEPDQWYEFGGTSSLRHFTAGEPGRERGLLTIACPTAAHLQLQTLLSRLNGYRTPARGTAVPGPSQHALPPSSPPQPDSEATDPDADPFAAPATDPFADPFGKLVPATPDRERKAYEAPPRPYPQRTVANRSQLKYPSQNTGVSPSTWPPADGDE